MNGNESYGYIIWLDNLKYYFMSMVVDIENNQLSNAEKFYCQSIPTVRGLLLLVMSILLICVQSEILIV